MFSPPFYLASVNSQHSNVETALLCLDLIRKIADLPGMKFYHHLFKYLSNGYNKN